MTKLESILLAGLVPAFWVVFAIGSIDREVKPTAPGERYDSKIPFAIAAMLAPCAVVAYAAGRSYGRSNPND